MAELIDIKKYDKILVLSLNRPDVRNALSKALLLALTKRLEEIKSQDDIRVVIITGSGDKAFCAGADLKERQTLNIEETRRAVALIQSTTQAISLLPMPTIAAINGDAFGGGLEIALACDMRIAARRASLGLTECSLGIIPGAGGTQRLSLIIGLSRAMELIFKASRLSSEEALSLGLINSCCADAQLMPTVLSWAEIIARNAPLAIRAAKKAIIFSSRQQIKEGLDYELKAYDEIIHTKDRLEGLRAFQEKRMPIFCGN